MSILSLIPTFSSGAVASATFSYYYDTGNTVSGDDAPFASGQLYDPRIVNVGNKSYICWTRDGGVGLHQQSMLIEFDHTTKEFSESIGIDYITANATEIHQQASIIDDENGDILSVNEDRSQSPLYVRRHDKDDLADQTLIETITPGYVAEGADGNTYSAWYKLGSNLFVISREGFRYLTVYKSTDQGNTFDSGTRVADSGDPDEQWMYFTPIHGNATNKIHLVINRRYQPPGFGGNWQAWYYLTSTDGNTWTNVSETFSKNISVSGSITLAELDSDFLVHDVGDIDIMSWCETGCVSDTGNIYLVGDKDNSVNIFCFWNGSSWTKRDIDLVPNNIHYRETKRLYSIDDNTFDLFAIVTQEGKEQLTRLRTTDKGLNWTLAETLSTNPDIDHQYIVMTHNAQVADHILIACSAYGEDGYNDIFFYEYEP